MNYSKAWFWIHYMSTSTLTCFNNYAYSLIFKELKEGKILKLNLYLKNCWKTYLKCLFFQNVRPLFPSWYLLVVFPLYYYRHYLLDETKNWHFSWILCLTKSVFKPFHSNDDFSSRLQVLFKVQSLTMF